MPWILCLVVSILIPIYDWLYIESECWDIDCKRITLFVSLVLSLLNIVILTALLITNCFYENNTSIGRIRFSSISFGVICILSTFNLIVALLMFMQKTCYFTQKVAEEKALNTDMFTTLSVKYDTKLSGVLHIFVAMFGFMVSMAFAIIKNNYKYIKQIDFDLE